MNHEFMSLYPFALKDSVTQVKAIDFLVGKQPPPSRWTKLGEIEDDWIRLNILAQSIFTPNKEQARSGTRRDAGGYRYWVKNQASAYLQIRFKEIVELDLVPSQDSLSIKSLPFGTWLLHFPFTLRKPYISHDDTDFYIIDNPIKKERVFKVPYIAPSQWKGSLRSAMMQELVYSLNNGQIDEMRFIDERLRLHRLFGNEKGGTFDFMNISLARYLDRAMLEDEQAKQNRDKDLKEKVKEIGMDFEFELLQKGYRHGDIDGFQGSLHFYPTYFNRIGLEVINPHNRKFGAGESPIYFECVPKDTSGTFSLLYVPLFGPEVNEGEAKEDWIAVTKGVKAMMTSYGFGAKTSSGFGTAKVQFDDAMVEPLEMKQAWLKEWRNEYK